MHSRRQSDGMFSSTTASARATPRMRTHRRSLASTSSVPRVEELKSKINQLELVLRQDKSDRELVYDRMDRIAALEAELERERSDKMDLWNRLEQALCDRPAGSTGTTSLVNRLSAGAYAPIGSNRDSTLSTQSAASSMRSDGLSSCTSATTTDDAMMAPTVVGSPVSDDWRKTDRLELRVRMLEAELDKISEVPSSEIEYQQHITELKLEKQTLLTEMTSLKRELAGMRDEAKSHKTKTQDLERELSSRTGQCNDAKDQLAAMRETISELTKRANDHKRAAQAKSREIEELQTRIRGLESDLLDSQTEVTASAQQLALLKQDLKHATTYAEQSQKLAQKELKTAAQQITALERTQRRRDRQIQTLEALTQDLKISLEEKAMENDELNRSIQRVMEQAHESIEDVKRRSMGSAYTYTASPSPRLSTDGAAFGRLGVSDLYSLSEQANEEGVAV